MSKTEEIWFFIADSVRLNQPNIARLASEKFGITRQAVLLHIRKMIAEGILTATGTTKARHYELIPKFEKVFPFTTIAGLQEDVVWRENALPLLADAPENVKRICDYGFTEMLNNAIEHSEGKTITVRIRHLNFWAELSILDDGVGIFKKIQKAMGLANEKEAALELTKGKFTTDPARHSGEGVFFTSRMFDEFSIVSYDMALLHRTATDDWIMPVDFSAKGTFIMMLIRCSATRTVEEVFDKFASGDKDYVFSTTHIPLSLAEQGEQLVSRSQAKRVLARLESFKEIFLDFKGVETIGQAFADEIFRVFQNAHPDINIIYINESEEVGKMIRRAKAARE